MTWCMMHAWSITLLHVLCKNQLAALTNLLLPIRWGLRRALPDVPKIMLNIDTIADA